MAMQIRIVAAVMVLAVAAMVGTPIAQADVINMGYETTSSNPGHNFIYDTTISAPTLTGFGTVDLFIDVDGTRYDFDDALFWFEGEQVGLALGTFPVFDGSFTFALPNEQVIVTAQLTGAVMSAVSIFSGAVFADSHAGVGPFGIVSSVGYQPGPAFPVASVVFADPQDFSFTLTSPQLVSQGVTSYDSSYSGNALYVPEPASAMLLGLATVCLIARRRTR